jgi:polar amino acid transport system substrate-binding protein
MTGGRSVAAAARPIRERAALAAAAVLLFYGTAPRPTPTPAAFRELAVAVYDAPPFSFRGADGRWRGLTVDLWTALAAEMKISYRFEEAPASAILNRIAAGTLDTSAGPFAATMEREKTLDFSHTYLNPGIGVAVRRSREAERWLSVLRALTPPSALRLYAGVLILIFVAGAIVWWVERRTNPLFSRRFLPGVGSGFWWAGVTTVGVGYGDKVPTTFWGRLVGIFWMSISLVLVTALTAFVTSKLAVAELGQVRNLQSMRSLLVGSVASTASAEFLRREAIPRRLYADIPQALQALARGDVQAVAYNSETLHYWVERDPGRPIEMLPGLLQAEMYAFPLADGSPLRDPLNAALRRMLDDPRWGEMKDRYLGAESGAPPP